MPTVAGKKFPYTAAGQAAAAAYKKRMAAKKKKTSGTQTASKPSTARGSRYS